MSSSCFSVIFTSFGHRRGPECSTWNIDVLYFRMGTDKRRGERLGWTLGNLGAFIWVLIFGIVYTVKGLYPVAFVFYAIFLSAVAAIRIFAPWRHPDTPYWKLLIPIYFHMGLSVWAAVWSYGGFGQSGLRVYDLVFLLVLIFPFFSLGRRKWNDGEGKP